MAAAEAEELLNAARQDRPPPRIGKIRDEIEVVLATLLPEVRLMRDSLNVISAEFSNRRALYRGLAELRTVAGRLPPTWKKLKGLDLWWERHMSDGQDDAGRVYARNSDRVWDVLVSHKSRASTGHSVARATVDSTSAVRIEKLSLNVRRARLRADLAYQLAAGIARRNASIPADGHERLTIKNRMRCPWITSSVRLRCISNLLQRPGRIAAPLISAEQVTLVANVFDPIQRPPLVLAL